MLIGDNQCEWLIRAGGRQRGCLCHLTVNGPLMVNPSPLCLNNACAASHTLTHKHMHTDLIQMKMRRTHISPQTLTHIHTNTCLRSSTFSLVSSLLNCQGQFRLNDNQSYSFLFFSVCCNQDLWLCLKKLAQFYLRGKMNKVNLVHAPQNSQSGTNFNKKVNLVWTLCSKNSTMQAFHFTDLNIKSISKNGKWWRFVNVPNSVTTHHILN